MTIATARVWLDEQCEPCEDHASQSQPYIMLSVTDTGTGMDDQTRQQIFEPFFTTKEEGKGTGLGLATVYSFVKQSDGKITVESSPGQGTSFRLFLPESDQPVDSTRKPVRLRPGKPITGTILVVEDDNAVRHLVVSVLRGQGHHVIEASDSRQALPLGEHYEGQIDLLVTDVVMPGMDGIQLGQRLLDVRPEMQLLFVTGYTNRTKDLAELVQQGTADLLVKPFSPDAIAQAVCRLLARARSDCQTPPGPADLGPVLGRLPEME
jgi:CheY-like chemotaxis protein